MHAPFEPPWDVVVLGAGPSGLLAATRAAERGRRVVLLEKNRKPGAKILVSGGARCNLTHATDAAGIIDAFGRPGRFLHSALAALSPRAVVQLFEAEGVPTTIEQPSGKVFPASNRAVDVQQALLRRSGRTGCRLHLGEAACGVVAEAGGFRIPTTAGEVHGARVVLATGGRSYPKCGTTGDAYPWLARLGHTIITPRPALVPVTSRAPWVAELSGISVPDAVVRVLPRAVGEVRAEPAERLAIVRLRHLAAGRGAVLWTHRGLSGPAVMDVSRAVTAHAEPESLDLVCDLLPDLSLDQIDERLRHGCSEHGGRSIARILPGETPQRLAGVVLEQCGLPRNLRAAEVEKRARRQLAARLKSLAVPVSGTLGFDKAEVTAGGVALEEVDSRTMESKLVPGLFLVGELLDLDGPIGGYNFQAAFSTGWLAGSSV